MTVLATVMIYGWILFSVILFRVVDATKAVLIVLIGGVLFLPMAYLDLPGFPQYNKNIAIGVSLFIGSVKISPNTKIIDKFRPVDIPMLLWCSLLPVITALSNGLSLYGGVSESLSNLLTWGALYWAGRKFINDDESLFRLVRGVIIGGVIYIPFIIVELSKGPFFHELLYGWLQHKLIQHMRYGGWRPIVFMQHGLMVSFWMTMVTIFSYSNWKMGYIQKLGKLKLSFLSVLFIVLTILCKSANGWIFLTLGLFLIYIYKRNSHNAIKWLRVIMSGIPIYFITRIFNIIPVRRFGQLFSIIFDSNRVASLLFRMWQEDLFAEKTLQRFWFGWAGYRRAYPVDPVTGKELFSILDSLWLGIFSTYGIAGLFSVFFTLGSGAYFILKYYKNKEVPLDINSEKRRLYLFLLCILVTFFMIDSLMNSMFNPVYVFCAGALVSQYYVNVSRNP